MCTYQERERRRKAKEPHTVLTIMVYWLALMASVSIAEAVGRLLWAPRWDKGVVAWGVESNGLQAGFEIVDMGSFDRQPSCRFHLKNVSGGKLLVDPFYPVDRSVEIAGREGPAPLWRHSARDRRCCRLP